jgi:2-dehydro-3-deoxyphosphooctonate aldolase (KDO 8-P synthase)
MSNLNLTRSPLFVIAGPCVIESPEMCLQIAQHLKSVCHKLGLVYVFKASFDKANRTSNSSFRGPGITRGLEILAQVKKEVGVTVLTDIHEPDHAPEAAKFVDILQIPAFLARQTDLLLAAGETGKTINVKKGQFMSPNEMATAIEKIKSTGNRNILLTERGTFFGYNRLVNDFTGLAIMKSFDVPVIFDITHSTQQPAALGTQSGGVDGIFLECHPDPKNAKSDPATVLDLNDVEPLLKVCKKIAEATRAV